ncbi:phosphatidylinositol glycan-related [Holotrichia oblita]|uniref:Phosphatidylinositol glycan-related n=1 Tax=Holotrichia oblita TaxID=644536 RepID=A0ACB9TQH8_HOLOL|nr:phosphatidylinositol glycan-related [Holotrichia oblita]
MSSFDTPRHKFRFKRDALRYDFITRDNTPNLLKLLETDGCLSLVKVESPTVTLPRIKALTTGSVPQFIDVVLNLLNTESATDSIIHQAVRYGKKIVFYGDDTWLKLYPNIFLRSEGTTSFYVYDYTEVDDNVTRNVWDELSRNDWDIMILHYLGLDHIGHITGPFSPLVKPKLQEMDEIVKKIYDLTLSENRIILVTGDHGMKDSGGHGGTTYSETRVPFLLLGESCSNDILSQSDIPLIISTFMGLSFPSNSIGKISTKILSSIKLEKLLYALNYNSLLLANKSDVCSEDIIKASDMYYSFLKGGDSSGVNEIVSLYDSCLRRMNSDLTHHSVTQDAVSLVFAIIALIYCLTGSILTILDVRNGIYSSEIIMFVIILICLLFKINRIFVVIFCLITVLLTINNLKQTLQHLFGTKIHLDIVLILSLNILHAISMAASSFIEEEHQIWYFYFTTFLLANYNKNNNIQVIIVLFLFRIIKQLNQTGDKWAAEPDISQWLLLADNSLYLHVLYIVSLVLIGIYCLKSICTNNLNKLITLIILVLIYSLKIYSPNYIILGQTIWYLIFINLAVTFKINILSLINTWILISTLLYRPQNLILIPFCIYTSRILSQRIESELILTISHLWLGNALYFCQGHSNSLASIDIGAGYVGLRDYNPVYVLLQLLSHTYSLPILSNLLLLYHCNNINVWNILAVFRLLIVFVTILISFVQRHHLFIWSVFAPKILLESSHTLMLLIQILIHHAFVFVIKLKKKNKFNLHVKVSI